MDVTNYPKQGSDGLLYEAFPQITLTLINGERIELDYFGKMIQNYLPTRYMEEGEFIPMVKYLSRFKSDNEVIMEFLRVVKNDIKELSNGVLRVGEGEYVIWGMVCKIEVKMQQYVYCLGKVSPMSADSKFINLNDEPYYVGLASNVKVEDEEKTEVQFKAEVNYDFLKCSAFEK